MKVVEVEKVEEVKWIGKVTSNDSTPMVYLPKPIREKVSIKRGDYVLLRVVDDKIIIEKLNI